MTTEPSCPKRLYDLNANIKKQQMNKSILNLIHILWSGYNKIEFWNALFLICNFFNKYSLLSNFMLFLGTNLNTKGYFYHPNNSNTFYNNWNWIINLKIFVCLSLFSLYLCLLSIFYIDFWCTNVDSFCHWTLEISVETWKDKK